MPELPEVETMVRDLSVRVVGATIRDTETFFPGSIRWPSHDDFIVRIRSSAIAGVSRRGKYAIFSVGSHDVLAIHRGMSGSLLLRPVDAPMESHVRILFNLDNGYQLRFNDPRKFGRVYLMDARGTETRLPWSDMGPEPLDDSFSLDLFAERLGQHRALIKPLLLNQHIVAGLGNIYVDEALHRARIHPLRRACTLSRDEIDRLHAAIRHVLTLAVQSRGTTFSTYLDIEGREGFFQDSLQVFRKAGSSCPCCGTTIVRTVVGGRGTHTCPACQQVS